MRLFIFLWLLLPFSLLSQSIIIKGKFTHTAGFEQVRLVSFKDSLRVLTHSVLKEGEPFSLQVQGIQSGIYRLQYGSNPIEHHVDLIVTTKDSVIELQMDLREENKELKVSGSVLNEHLYKYLIELKKNLAQLRFHYQTYHSAPDKNQKAVVLSAKEFEKTHKTLLKEEQKFLKLHKNDLSGLYVMSRPLLLPTLTLDPKMFYQKKYEAYWQKLPITNEALQNTPFYNVYLLEYLGYHFNQILEPEPWELQMKKAVDTVMHFMGQTEYTNKLALHYMIEGFKALGHEGLLQFIDEKYAQGSQCIQGALQEDVAFRLKSYQVGKKGQQIPNFPINTTHDFYSVVKGKTILIFWSSTCPHCMEEWPAIETWNKDNPEYHIIAISLDTDKVVYQEAINKLPKDITYLCDYKGYESDYVKPFYIMATPTFFEVNENKQFVRKDKKIN